VIQIFLKDIEYNHETPAICNYEIDVVLFSLVTTGLSKVIVS
jgi:hypothetical protein